MQLVTLGLQMLSEALHEPVLILAFLHQALAFELGKELTACQELFSIGEDLNSLLHDIWGELFGWGLHLFVLN